MLDQSRRHGIRVTVSGFRPSTIVGSWSIALPNVASLATVLDLIGYPLRLDSLVRSDHHHSFGRLQPFFDHLGVGAMRWQFGTRRSQAHATRPRSAARAYEMKTSDMPERRSGKVSRELSWGRCPLASAASGGPRSHHYFRPGLPPPCDLLTLSARIPDGAATIDCHPQGSRSGRSKGDVNYYGLDPRDVDRYQRRPDTLSASWPGLRRSPVRVRGRRQRS